MGKTKEQSNRIESFEKFIFNLDICMYVHDFFDLRKLLYLLNS